MAQEWTPGSSAPSTKIPNHLVLTIVASAVSLICCCIPHGVISLIFALQVDKKAAAGDLEGAAASAKQAKTFAWISIIVAIVGGVLAFVFGLFATIMSMISGS